jgi:hypothetical protein
MALATVTMTTIYFGAPCVAWAQGTSTGGASLTMPSAAQAPALPYGADQVVKMYQSGISKDILINYVNNTVLPYHLDAEGLIYLHNLGMPQEVTQAMIQRDGQLQQQQAMQRYYQPAAAAAPSSAATTQPTVVTPATPAPEVTVIGGSDYPSYDYGYPYYDYSGPYYGGWPLWYGGWGGWGWGWGGRGWGWGHGGFGRGGFGRGGFGGFHGGGGFGGGGFHGGGGHGGGGGHR